MRKLISTILALCMVLCLLPVTAAADDANPAEPTETVKLDVGAENGENEEYKITDDAINIRKDGVVYELTGTTDKKLQMWGSNSPDPVKTFYLRLNGATINGGITITNPSGAKLVIEVVDGTENTVQRIVAVDLTITGAGTLNATDLGTTQQSSSDSRKLTSALYIKDTTIKVDRTTANPSEWNGKCVLDGNANVTYTSYTDHAPLALGQTYAFAHSLTMKGDSKLYCLQGVETSASSVSGLEAFNAAITLQDNAYLEAVGRATTGRYAGYGVIITQGSITVENNATIKATAYDTAIVACDYTKVGGCKITVDGGKIIANSVYGCGIYGEDGVDIRNGAEVTANSTNSNGIYTDSAISISNGATVEAEGYYPAVFGSTGVSIANSTVKATSSDDGAIFSRADVTIRDSVIKATGAEDYYGVSAENGVSASGSWIETTGPESPADSNYSIADSVLFNGKTGKVIGNATLPADAAVAQGMTLDIPAGTTLTVPEGKTFTNNGTVNVADENAVTNNGTTLCSSHSGGTATCVEAAKCSLCKAFYGDKDSTNHVGLKHTDAKDATLAEAGNIEYWFCPACGKYFSDANAANEITRESTVIPALKAPGIKPADGKGVYTKNSGKDLAFTTENMPEKIKVKVGSTVLTEGKDYTVSNGSIVLKTSYLESLGYGSYTLVVTDANGVELARTSFTKSFTVRPAQQPALSGGKTAASGSGVTSAGTGDAGVAMYAVSAVLSLTGSAWVVGKKRK